MTIVDSSRGNYLKPSVIINVLFRLLSTTCDIVDVAFLLQCHDFFDMFSILASAFWNKLISGNSSSETEGYLLPRDNNNVLLCL